MVWLRQASKIDVVAPTALPGTDLALDEIPAPVQTASARDLQQSGSLDLSDLLNRRLDGVHINENQANPFQPDVNYRGYTASPLLGTPEGISVYMDGVRQNQPFGDVVAWDLIPKIAISELALMPGSNPLFGLNTLGGAISIQTKDGYSQPGAALQLSGGSFGRRAGEFEYGGSNSKGLNWYAAGNLFREDGWRPFSPSEVRQAFGKFGWTNGKTSLALSFGYADNWLTGNGLQDTRLLARNYSERLHHPRYHLEPLALSQPECPAQCHEQSRRFPATPTSASFGQTPSTETSTMDLSTIALRSLAADIRALNGGRLQQLSHHGKCHNPTVSLFGAASPRGSKRTSPAKNAPG